MQESICLGIHGKIILKYSLEKWMVRVESRIICVGFEVLTVVVMKSTIFCEYNSICMALYPGREYSLESSDLE
jgi:hypothetical protein